MRHHGALRERLGELHEFEASDDEPSVWTGEKGERDLLVALGVLATSTPGDIDELEGPYRRLRPELRHVVRSSLTVLSLLAPRSGMPDPQPRRAEVAALLRRLEAADPEAR